MNGLLAVTMALGLVLVPRAAIAAPDVSGTWDLEMKWVGALETITSAGVCTFERHGDMLAGTCGSGSDRFPIVGRIDGNRLSWRVDVGTDGSAGRMEFSGELDEQGTTIRGACSVTGGQDGTFTMKKHQRP